MLLLGISRSTNSVMRRSTNDHAGRIGADRLSDHRSDYRGVSVARSSALRLRSTAVALAASACLIGGVASAQAAPAGAEAALGGAPTYRDFATGPLKQKSVAPEVRTFTGSGMGTSPSQAVNGAVRMAYTVAQSAGWQANQCHVRATNVRSVGGGVYSAVADLFCQR
jgi:hypothetical protein